MNTILTTAMTWTIGSVAGAFLASQIIKAELMPLNQVSERIADATGHKTHKAMRGPVETFFSHADWSKDGGVGGAAFEISERFAELFAGSADRSAQEQ